MTSGNDRPTADEPRDVELDRRLAALTRSAEPAASNWSVIRKRIETTTVSVAPRRFRPVWPIALAAAVVLAAVATVVWQAPRMPSEMEVDAGRVLVQSEVRAMRKAAPVVTGGLEVRPPLAEAWLENQTAIDELEAALDRDPDNRLLLEFLAEARLRQVRMLNAGLVSFPRTDV